MLKIVATTDNFQTNLPNPTSNQEIGGSIGQSPRERIHKSYDLKVTGGVGRVCKMEIVTSKIISINQPLQIRLNLKKHANWERS